MITSDPARRAAILAEVMELLQRQAPADDRALLLAFAPVVYMETPDRVVFGFSPEALAARLLDQYQFVVREMPPPTQLYRGLPGIHVSARNPNESGWVSKGRADGISSEITFVQTHTIDTPFIFESLKNYFIKAKVRVMSAVH